jgi:Zn-finger nucleic acid-binding protein
MQCPSCRQLLATQTVAGIELDACGACGGYWFDEGEVLRLVARLKSAPEVPELDLKTLLRKPEPAPFGNARTCPRCAAPMAAFNYCYDSNVILDRCERCRGVWMDGGELNRVLSYAKGNRTMNQLGQAMVAHMDELDEWPGFGVGAIDDSEDARDVWSTILAGVATLMSAFKR